jgi:hypothetical protein
MAVFDQPMNSMTARSGTPSTSRTVAAVCRASCNRASRTPASSRSAFHSSRAQPVAEPVDHPGYQQHPEGDHQRQRDFLPAASVPGPCSRQFLPVSSRSCALPRSAAPARRYVSADATPLEGTVLRTEHRTPQNPPTTRPPSPCRRTHPCTPDPLWRSAWPPTPRHAGRRLHPPSRP